ncbi:MAG: DUF4159 domain-containing protein [Candidatus Marinimicrobia bacterium]|nr:DUF4159 domain-containing protein [Candidatus Neomarinimicrobiota bacterium]
MKKVIKSIIVILIAVLSVSGQSKNLLGKFTIARLKYDGGGDWYSNPSSLPNLLKFLHENVNMDVATDEVRVGIMDKDFFAYPYLYMNGHGNVRFSDEEVLRLRQHLQNGGFLHADDNYGLDQSFRREIKRVFPDNDLVELPFDHPIYHILYEFPNGLPKIHEHDNKPPQGLGIFYKGRLVVFYTYECDLGDGWEDPKVHNDPEEKHQAALKMGANIVIFSLMQ